MPVDKGREKAGLAIGHQHGRRPAEDEAEAMMVRSGAMTRSSQDWGLTSGFDDARAPLLLKALRARAAGIASDIVNRRRFGSKTISPLSGWVDDLVARTGLSAAHLANDLANDIGCWEPYWAAMQALSKRRKSRRLWTASRPAATHLAIPNKRGGGGVKMAAAVEAMVSAVEENRISYGALATMKQKALSALHSNAGRTLLTQAREEALSQLRTIGYSDKIQTNDK